MLSLVQNDEMSELKTDVTDGRKPTFIAPWSLYFTAFTKCKYVGFKYEKLLQLSAGRDLFGTLKVTSNL